MTIMTRSAELKSYPCYPGQGETPLLVSQRTGQIRTKDVIQECHPDVDVNNEEVNPPELIINDRSVPVLLLLPLDTGDTPRPCLDNDSRL